MKLSANKTDTSFSGKRNTSCMTFVNPLKAKPILALEGPEAFLDFKLRLHHRIDCITAACSQAVQLLSFVHNLAVSFSSLHCLLTLYST
jgi:hypothetical protein